jgi:hypothetical protein
VNAHARSRERATSFEHGNQGGVIVHVTLNGRGPFRFLLDTGSTHSVVSEAVAARIGAPVVARTVVGSVLGSRERLVVRIDRLECGALDVANLLPSVADMDEVDHTRRLDGVIGQDALAGLRYTMDFGRRLVRWWPDPATIGPGAAFPLQASGGRFLVSLPQGGAVLRLVPDSGAGLLLLFAQADQELPPMRLLARPAQLATLSARGTIRRGTVLELQVGPTLLRHIPAVVVARPDSVPEGFDGLLPLHLFERVTFDGPRRLLILEGQT